MTKFRLIFECFVVGFMFNTLCQGQVVHRSTFGEHCNETIKCDKSAWLKCQSNSCACLMEDMIHDATRGKCVSKPGERCKFQISESVSDNVGMTVYESTTCVANAHCDNGFTCACDAGYFETVDGDCVEQKDINATCSSSVECKESKFLFCIQDSCLCSDAHAHIYATPYNNNSLSTCATKAGKTISGRVPCIKGTSPRYDICACDDANYNYAGDDGYCHRKKGFGDACVADDECQFVEKYFTCVGGKCGCEEKKTVFFDFEKTRLVTSYQLTVVWSRTERNPSGYGQYHYERRYENGTDRIVEGEWLEDVPDTNSRFGYVNETIQTVVTDKFSQCVGLAGQRCNPESHCVKNSECVNDVCVCSDNFSPTSTGTCGIGYGKACTEVTQCSDAFQCTNGICNCPQAKHQIYSNDRQKCVGRVSSFCTDDSDCSTNTVCNKVLETGQKQCVCAEGFVEDRLGNCDKAWNSTCNAQDSTLCDTVAQLECRNGFCACPDTLTHYDAMQRKCLGIVGARCFRKPEMAANPKDVFECSAGSHCVQMTSNPWVAGRCLCQTGFERGSDKLCHKIASANYTDFAS